MKQVVLYCEWIMGYGIKQMNLKFHSATQPLCGLVLTFLNSTFSGCKIIPLHRITLDYYEDLIITEMKTGQHVVDGQEELMYLLVTQALQETQGCMYVQIPATNISGNCTIIPNILSNSSLQDSQKLFCKICNSFDLMSKGVLWNKRFLRLQTMRTSII